VLAIDLPSEDVSAACTRDDGFDGAPARDELGRSYWDDPDLAMRQLFSGCEPQDAAAATARLRPQARAPNVEPCPLEQWPAPFLSHPAEVADALS
jgi:hypothetical protein